MTADLASLLAAGIPRPLFYAWSALAIAISVVGHLRIQRRYRRFVRKTKAELRRLEQRADEYEKRVEAEVAQMRAELDAYGVWSEANDRFFHHGLVAVSHLLGARALPARRACIGERRSTHGRRAAPRAWRPKPTRPANPASSTGSAVRIHRRSGT
ncbi:hypothetical protein [Candidatus Poriferisodalis sp.]|uniref:hypothetical protein n=1 Tax=Candidatus Poriferisodalis sp. TaxID=3101277 RepID=UPI003B018FAF